MNRRTSEKRIGATLLIVMLGLMSLGYAGTGQALSGHVAWRETTLFSDNFDRHLLGSFPSTGGWETVWPGRDGGRENKTVYGPSVSQPQSFQLWGSPNWSAVVQRKFSTTAAIIGYEFAIRIEKIGTGGPGREESPGFFCKEAATWGGYYARVFFSHDTKRIEGEGGVVLGTWEPGRWYRVKVMLVRTPIAPGIPGLDSNVYSVWIDGKLAGQNIKTAGDTYQINALALFSGHPGVKVWYDDVRVFTVDQVSLLTAPEWHIDFQGDYFHAGTYGQTGPVAHSPAGVHWNVFEVPALKQPWPTPYATYPSLLLREKGGLMTGVSLCIEGDAYGWAGGAGADPLVGDYLIFLTHNAFGVSNNPTWWKIRGLAPDTRYCLTFYHALGATNRGLVFGVLHAFHTSLVEVSGVPGRNVASECVTSSGEGTITGWVKVDDRLGVEGDWAGLTIRLETQPPHSVSTPGAPSGPSEGKVGETLVFHVSGGECNVRAHLVEFRFDWGDGTFSDWFIPGVLIFSLPNAHAWNSEGTYQVRVQSRCRVDTSIVSGWSPAKTVTIRAAPTVGESQIDFDKVLVLSGVTDEAGRYSIAVPTIANTSLIGTLVECGVGPLSNARFELSLAPRMNSPIRELSDIGAINLSSPGFMPVSASPNCIPMKVGADTVEPSTVCVVDVLCLNRAGTAVVGTTDARGDFVVSIGPSLLVGGRLRCCEREVLSNQPFRLTVAFSEEVQAGEILMGQQPTVFTISVPGYVDARVVDFLTLPSEVGPALYFLGDIWFSSGRCPPGTYEGITTYTTRRFTPVSASAWVSTSVSLVEVYNRMAGLGVWQRFVSYRVEVEVMTISVCYKSWWDRFWAINGFNRREDVQKWVEKDLVTRTQTKIRWPWDSGPPPATLPEPYEDIDVGGR